jgi:uncharacterized membrane-anchored protein YitT (DUF2179 family)
MLKAKYMLYFRQTAMHTAKRLALISLGSFLMALNLNTFVHAGALIPGGFMGVVLLVQECFLVFGGVELPFSVLLFALNAVPVIISYRYIGKWFTLYSCLMILISGLLTDWMPRMFVEHIQLHDTLLAAVFGGILNAVSISLCLFAGATSGGTDFIAIFISEKYGKDAWNYIFAGNCVVLAITGWLFALDKALYSIIFQYTTTAALRALYQSYQQKTLFIITAKPNEIYALIRDKTRHGATLFRGVGFYQWEERAMVYSVIAANQVTDLLASIRKLDSGAFVNVLRTDELTGRFYRPPKD